MIVLRAKLIEKLSEQVPHTISFDVGYYEGSQHSKIWLCSANDLESMYKKYPSGEITLWCHGNEDEETSCGKRKRSDSSCNIPSKRQKKEDDVDSVFKDLKEKHGSKFGTPQLRLWARMVSNDLHDDLEEPPNIPAFCSTPKRPGRQSVSTAISGAAIALSKVLGGTPQDKANCCQAGVSSGVSPGKAIELRMKNYEQLRYLQQLLDDGILSQSEYTEQKQDILGSLRKLYIIVQLFYEVAVATSTVILTIQRDCICQDEKSNPYSLYQLLY